ncbi:hypothetical protein TWF706_006970 [Orbilia oligospora]|nr:hypothetical protein TWF706_006970 [Orbilia oligospora]
MGSTIKFSYLLTISLILSAASSALGLRPLFSKRSANQNDLMIYTAANRDRLETLWGALVDFQADIESYPIDRDPGLGFEANDIIPTLGIFGRASVFTENDSKPILGFLGMIKDAKPKLKILINQIPGLGAQHGVFKDPSLDNFLLDITNQQPAGDISLNAALLDIPESQNPSFLELTHVQDQYHYQNQDEVQDQIQDQIQSPAEINAGFFDFPEDAEDSDSDINPNDQVILDISAGSHPGPDAGVIEVMTNALETLYFALSAVENLKADVQPDFFTYREQWQFDQFSGNVWQTLDAYYRYMKLLYTIYAKGKTKKRALMAIWVFHWLRDTPATPEVNGVINLSSKLDLEEGNMDLAVAIDEAMEEYWKALSQAIEFVFSFVPKKNVKIEALKEELITIYDYMAVYEGNLRKVAAIIQGLDAEWELWYTNKIVVKYTDIPTLQNINTNIAQELRFTNRQNCVAWYFLQGNLPNLKFGTFYRQDISPSIGARIGKRGFSRRQDGNIMP